MKRLRRALLPSLGVLSLSACAAQGIAFPCVCCHGATCTRYSLKKELDSSDNCSLEIRLTVRGVDNVD